MIERTARQHGDLVVNRDLGACLQDNLAKGELELCLVELSSLPGSPELQISACCHHGNSAWRMRAGKLADVEIASVDIHSPGMFAKVEIGHQRQGR